MGRGMQEVNQDFYRPVFQVVHTRYLRFYSDGTIVTMISAEQPRHALKAIAAARAARGSEQSSSASSTTTCGVGTFVQNGCDLECNFAVRLDSHPKMKPLMQTFHLTLNSTKRAAWNRLRWLEHYQTFESGVKGGRGFNRRESILLPFFLSLIITLILFFLYLLMRRAN